MFYTYVIKSITHDFYYKGHCQNIEKRLAEHNNGVTKSIKPYIPFKLVYLEEFTDREDAIKKEQYFKSAAGRRFLKRKIDSYQKSLRSSSSRFPACRQGFQARLHYNLNSWKKYLVWGRTHGCPPSINCK